MDVLLQELVEDVPLGHEQVKQVLGFLRVARALLRRNVFAQTLQKFNRRRIIILIYVNFVRNVSNCFLYFIIGKL